MLSAKTETYWYAIDQKQAVIVLYCICNNTVPLTGAKVKYIFISSKSGLNVWHDWSFRLFTSSADSSILLKINPLNERIQTLEMWMWHVCLEVCSPVYALKCFRLLFPGWCFGGRVRSATDSRHINKGWIQTTALRLKHFYRVTFIHAKPFDLRTLRFWCCVGLCTVTTTVLACGLSTYWSFFLKMFFPFLLTCCLTLISLVYHQYY